MEKHRESSTSPSGTHCTQMFGFWTSLLLGAHTVQRMGTKLLASQAEQQPSFSTGLCCFVLTWWFQKERGQHQSRLEMETREELALLPYRAAASIRRDEACSERCVKP